MHYMSALPARPIPLGRLVFDPWFILSQIAVMQALFYLSLGTFLLLSNSAFKRHLSLDQFFSAGALSLHTLAGAMTMICHFLTVFPGAWGLLWIVERSKRCLDFAVTVHLVHLMLCAIMAGFPTTFEWWALSVMNVTAMTLIGEYLCVKRELRDIPLQNPDEQHRQQAQLVRHKQDQLHQERTEKLAAAAAVTAGQSPREQPFPPPSLWGGSGAASGGGPMPPHSGGEGGTRGGLHVLAERGVPRRNFLTSFASAFSSAGYSRVPQSGKE